MKLEKMLTQRYEPHISKKGFTKALIGLGIFTVGSLFNYGFMDELVALSGGALFGCNLSQSWGYLKYKLLGR